MYKRTAFLLYLHGFSIFFIKRKVMSDMESREFVNVKDLPLYCIHSNEFVIFYCVF
jgi:hypothetical protein